jgi:hypothetical protein
MPYENNFEGRFCSLKLQNLVFWKEMPITKDMPFLGNTKIVITTKILPSPPMGLYGLASPIWLF